MNSLTRFQATLSFQPTDRPPFFDEGIREDVLREWHRQGLPSRAKLEELFQYDQREEIELDLEPRPYPRRFPRRMEDLGWFRRRLDPARPHRLPKDWEKKVSAWQERDFPLILPVHRGFFLSLGVGDWKTFYEVIYLTQDQPGLVEGMMEAQGEFAARLVERVLSQVKVEAALFSEPIGGNNGPIISPRMYREFALRNYQPLMEVFKRFGVELVIMRTYANPRPLLEDMFKLGINCLWACETPEGREMDYRELRRVFGREFRLIGGIDADALRAGKDTIRREMLKVPELLAQGGYIPLLDGRVRVDVPYENYVYYRRRLEEMTG